MRTLAYFALLFFVRIPSHENYHSELMKIIVPR